MTSRIDASTPLLKEAALPTDKKHEDAALRRACGEFESFMLQQILSLARQSEPQGGLFEQTHATEMFRALQDEETARQMAHGGGVGLGEVLYRQLAGRAKATVGNSPQNQEMP